MNKRNLSLSELHKAVLEGKIDEGDYLEIEENNSPELVFYSNHGNKALTARRGENKDIIKVRGKYIELVEYNGLPQAPTIIRFSEGSEDYSKFNKLLMESNI